MGHQTLIYKEKVLASLEESYIHLQRLDEALAYLMSKYHFPLHTDTFQQITESSMDLAYSDQIIYRFSKLQDTMGAKLFRALLLYQGENINRPFLDLLNRLESMDIIDVDNWFEIRDLRNIIAHDYDADSETTVEVLNKIYAIRNDLRHILDAIQKLV